MAIIQTSEFSVLYEKYLKVQQFKNKKAIIANAISARTKLQNIKAEHDDNKPVSLLELKMYVDLYNFWALQLNEPKITVEQVLVGNVIWISHKNEEKSLPVAIVLALGIKELPIKELISLFYKGDIKELISLFYKGDIRVFYGLDILVGSLVAGIEFAGIIALHLPATSMATTGLLVRVMQAYLDFCATAGSDKTQQGCFPSPENCKNIFYAGPRSLTLLVSEIEKMAKGELE